MKSFTGLCRDMDNSYRAHFDGEHARHREETARNPIPRGGALISVGRKAKVIASKLPAGMIVADDVLRAAFHSGNAADYLYTVYANTLVADRDSLAAYPYRQAAMEIEKLGW